MRSLVTVVVLAGCRLHFDERAASDAGDAPQIGDAGGDAAPVDPAPLALACNTPVALSSSTSANPHLNAAAIGNDFIVFWLDDQGHVATQFGALVAPDALQINPATVDLQGVCSMGSAAVTDTTLLLACGSIDMTASGETLLQPYDTTTGAAIGGSTLSPIRIVSTQGLAAISGGFVLGGTRVAPTESDVVGLSTTGAAVSSIVQMVAGNTNERVAGLPNGMAVGVAFGPPIACTARLYGSGLLGPAVTWGNTGMCQEPIAIPSTSGTTVLLVRKDTSDGDLNHQVATVSGNTLSLPGEGKLSGVADEPRGIALGTGYWVSYHTAANTIEAVAVDAAGGKGTPHALGPMASLDAHDVLAIAGEPYAVWFSNGLQIAHLCP